MIPSSAQETTEETGLAADGKSGTVSDGASLSRETEKSSDWKLTLVNASHPMEEGYEPVSYTHLRKALYGFCEIFNRLIHISVFDSIPDTVLDMALQNDLAYLVER